MTAFITSFTAKVSTLAVKDVIWKRKEFQGMCQLANDERLT